MAIRDNIFYELAPQAGDVSPHNEINTSEILSGGTIALVDRGGGDYAWQFSGTNSLATIANRVYTPGAAAGGFTMAITVKVTAAASAFSRYASMQVSSSTGEYLGVGENGSNNMRARFVASSSGSNAFSGIGSTEVTIVARVTTAGAGAEVLESWKGVVGRSGTAPDVSTAMASGLSRTFNQITAGGGSGTVQIKRLVFWNEELSNADCALIADDPATALAIAGTTVVGTVGDAVAAGVVASVSQGAAIVGGVGAGTADGVTASILSGGTINTAVGAATAAAMTATVTTTVTITSTVGGTTAAGSTASVYQGSTIFGIVGNVTADGSAATVANTAGGSFITEPLINNTGAGNVLASQAVVWTWFPDGRIGALDLITAVDGAGTTDALGQLTVTGLSAGAGMLWVAVLNTDATDDAVFYEAGTVT